MFDMQEHLHWSIHSKIVAKQIYLKIKAQYSTTWPTLDAPSPHTKWLSTGDIDFVMEIPKAQPREHMYCESKVLG